MVGIFNYMKHVSLYTVYTAYTEEDVEWFFKFLNFKKLIYIFKRKVYFWILDCKILKYFKIKICFNKSL